METTYAKLRNGSWGLKGLNLSDGALVTVVKRDGSSKSERVGRILWRGQDGACLACIAEPVRVQSERRGGFQGRRSRSNWRPCGYPGCSPSYCDERDGEGG
jgi:hypothetical protein